MFHYATVPSISEPILSPIQEETEELLMALTPDVICDKPDNTPCFEQRNNNTPLEPDEMDSSKSGVNFKPSVDMGKTTSPEMEKHNVPNLTVTRFRRDEKRVQEPVRRPEASVEVLKQKYINMDIQDIPSGIAQGPVRYGRLHRSRSMHVNLASQDIRSQMNKLRLKAGLNNTGFTARMQYRCSRLLDDVNTANAKTLEEWLKGEGYGDDYDPELARLFDDYVEECDQITRGELDTDTALVRRIKDRKECDVSKPVDVETKEAFWRGFMEGMNHISHSKYPKPEESDVLDLALQMNVTPREAIQDPCMDKTSQTDMIRSNQDITHKFLKEWEQLNSTQNKVASEQKSISACFACDTEQKMLEDLLVEKSGTSNRLSPTSDTTKEKLDNKLSAQRDILHLGKTSINLKLDSDDDIITSSEHAITCARDKLDVKTGANKPIVSARVQNVDGKKHSCDKTDIKGQKSRDTTAPIFKVTNGVLPGISAQKSHDVSKEDNQCSKANLDSKVQTRSSARNLDKRQVSKAGKKDDEAAKLAKSPFMAVRKDLYMTNDRSQSRSSHNNRDDVKRKESKDDMVADEKDFMKNEKAIEKLGKIKNTLDDALYKELQFRDENISIITLAKMKLENKCMSSLGMDDFVKSRKDVPRVQTPRCRSEELEYDKERAMMKNLIRDLDLDGWEAKTKPFCEQDNLHLSSSELLHPVDSSESFSSPSLWRQSCSTPLLTSLDKKFLMLKSNEQTPMGSRTMTPERCTPTSARLSDLEDKTVPRRKYETTAFKPSNHVLKNKMTERVKLRLTKSCDSFVAKGGQYKDPAFANIPLARCLSYNIEQRMKSGLTTAANINLTESLAKQLKDLGKDKEKDKRTTPREKCVEKREEMCERREVDVTTTTDTLPALDGKKLVTSNSETTQDMNIVGTILPEIETCNSTKGLDVKSKGESAMESQVPKGQVLPPLCCTSLLSSETNLTSVKAAGSDVQQPKVLHCDEESELWMNRSLPCRTESLQSPYTFDKADPSKLLLKARALPCLHSVCTSCGGINERHENTSGHERSGVGGGHDKGKFGKNVHHRCVTPGNDEKWKLEKIHTDKHHEFPKIDVLKFRNEPNGKAKTPKNIKKTLSYNDYSKYERTTKARPDEMTFKFLDQNIKLRFEVDLPSEEKLQLIESFNGTQDLQSTRLTDMSKPRRREKLECPIARETRIYKEKKRQKYLLKNGEKSQEDSPVPSPYLEYCKRKAHLQAVKETRHRENYVDLNNDSRVVDRHSTESTKHRKRFPVIQAKTSKETSKKSARVHKSQKDKSSKHIGRIREPNGLRVEPGILPTISAVSPKIEDKQEAKKQFSGDPSKNVDKLQASNTRLPSLEAKPRVNVDLTMPASISKQNELSIDL